MISIAIDSKGHIAARGASVIDGSILISANAGEAAAITVSAADWLDGATLSSMALDDVVLAGSGSTRSFVLSATTTPSVVTMTSSAGDVRKLEIVFDLIDRVEDYR